MGFNIPAAGSEKDKEKKESGSENNELDEDALMARLQKLFEELPIAEQRAKASRGEYQEYSTYHTLKYQANAPRNLSTRSANETSKEEEEDKKLATLEHLKDLDKAEVDSLISEQKKIEAKLDNMDADWRNKSPII